MQPATRSASEKPDFPYWLVATAVLAVAAAPLGHAAGKDLLARPVGLSADLLEQLVQGFARPEGPVKDRRLAARLAVLDVLLDDDRPAPERHDQKHDHDDLHRQRRACKKGEHGEINLLRHRKGFGFHTPALVDRAVSRLRYL